MITSINSKNYAKYSVFFNEAWEALYQKGAITKDEYDVGAPTTLEEYFVYANALKGLTDSLEKTKYKYLMLPLDEPAFDIDANTRKITVPPNFAKHGVGVQGDVIAESLFFRIDRFFDHMDLLNTDIFIQWKNANKEEGATRISTVDYESQADDGKLLIMWPLYEKICAVPGPLQFSVRFLKRESDESKRILYSLNTLPATININAALKSDMDYVELDDPSGLFQSAIENSETTIGPKPDIPNFETGLDLPSEVYLDNNTYTFKAQATTNDNPNIIYEWHHIDMVGNNNILTEGVEDEFVEVTNPIAPTPENEKVYYVKNDTAPTGYSVYDGDVFPPVDKVTGENIPVFTRYSTYTIVDNDDEVVGSYYTVAKNKRQKYDPANPQFRHGLSQKESGRCLMPAPKELEVSTLPDHAFITDGSINLSASATTDNKERTTIEYKLLRSTAADQTNPEEIVTNNYTGDFTVTDAVPGWYAINSVATLNRASIEDTTNFCKVTNHPAAPKIEPTEDQMDDLNLDYIYLEKNEERTLSVRITTPFTSIFESEEVLYTWYKSPADSSGEWVEITMGNANNPEVIGGIGTGNLRIKFTGQATNYICQVTNVLGGKSESSYSGIFTLQLPRIPNN